MTMQEASPYMCGLCGCESRTPYKPQPQECLVCDRGDGSDERWISSVPTSRLVRMLAERDAVQIQRQATPDTSVPMPARLRNCFRNVYSRPDAAGYVWRLAQRELDLRIPPRAT